MVYKVWGCARLKPRTISKNKMRQQNAPPSASKGDILFTMISLTYQKDVPLRVFIVF
jgi:hypothetical protein